VTVIGHFKISAYSHWILVKFETLIFVLQVMRAPPVSGAATRKDGFGRPSKRKQQLRDRG